jgi:hypothetical protein
MTKADRWCKKRWYIRGGRPTTSDGLAISDREWNDRFNE